MRESAGNAFPCDDCVREGRTSLTDVICKIGQALPFNPTERLGERGTPPQNGSVQISSWSQPPAEPPQESRLDLTTKALPLLTVSIKLIGHISTSAGREAT